MTAETLREALADALGSLPGVGPVEVVAFAGDSSDDYREHRLGVANALLSYPSVAALIAPVEDGLAALERVAYRADGTSRSCRWCDVFEGLDHRAARPISVLRDEPVR